MQKETAQEGYRTPFGEHPLLGHIAIYSLNLILLRVIVGDAPYVFDESCIDTHEDGARPWDRLMYIWRSWFALDNLNGVTAVMIAVREGSQIRIHAKERFQVAESQGRIEMCLSVSNSISDTISSGLVGLLLYDPLKDNLLRLEDIDVWLRSEKLDLEFQIEIKRLFLIESRVNFDNARVFANTVRKTLDMALRGEKHLELEHISLSFRRGMRRLMQRIDGCINTDQDMFEIFRLAVDHDDAVSIARSHPQVALILYEAANDISYATWKKYFLDSFQQIAFQKDNILEIIECNPEAALVLLKLVLKSLGKLRFYNLPTCIEQSLEPNYLLQLSERNPEAALVLLKLTWEIQAVGFLDSLDESSIFAKKLRGKAWVPTICFNCQSVIPKLRLSC